MWNWARIVKILAVCVLAGVLLVHILLLSRPRPRYHLHSSHHEKLKWRSEYQLVTPPVEVLGRSRRRAKTTTSLTSSRQPVTHFSRKLINRRPVNLLNFKWFVSNRDVCKNSSLELVIIVKSAPGNARFRKALRTSWTQSRCWRWQVRVLFNLGMIAGSKMMSAVMQESVQHKDLLISDIMDSYYNNTAKTMSAITWTQMYCPGARYYLLIDDDMFVRPQQLYYYLQSSPSELYSTLFAGVVRRGERPRRDVSSKWFIPRRMFAARSYPDYCPAGFLLISSPVMTAISREMLFVPRFLFDDIFLGLVLRNLRITPTNIPTVYIDWLNRIDKLAYRAMMACHVFRDSKKLLGLFQAFCGESLCC